MKQLPGTKIVLLRTGRSNWRWNIMSGTMCLASGFAKTTKAAMRAAMETKKLIVLALAPLSAYSGLMVVPQPNLTTNGFSLPPYEEVIVSGAGYSLTSTSPLFSGLNQLSTLEPGNITITCPTNRVFGFALSAVDATWSPLPDAFNFIVNGVATSAYPAGTYFFFASKVTITSSFGNYLCLDWFADGNVMPYKLTLNTTSTNLTLQAVGPSIPTTLTDGTHSWSICGQTNLTLPLGTNANFYTK